VSKTLGKGPNTLGKAFAECHTRQRAHGKILASKEILHGCYVHGCGVVLVACVHGKEHTAGMLLLNDGYSVHNSLDSFSNKKRKSKI